MNPKNRRGAVGIFGGSFDPPHTAHIEMARLARDFLGLDLIVFVPACSSPPKFGNHAAAFDERVKMLEIALGGFSGSYEISRIEAHSNGVSFASDTVAKFAERFPDADLYWLAGADMAASIPHWRGAEKLFSLAKFAVFERAGVSFDFATLPPEMRFAKIPMRGAAVSSSRIRAELKRGISPVRGLDKNVLAYIKSRGLYA